MDAVRMTQGKMHEDAKIWDAPLISLFITCHFIYEVYGKIASFCSYTVGWNAKILTKTYHHYWGTTKRGKEF